MNRKSQCEELNLINKAIILSENFLELSENGKLDLSYEAYKIHVQLEALIKELVQLNGEIIAKISEIDSKCPNCGESILALGVGDWCCNNCSARTIDRWSFEKADATIPVVKSRCDEDCSFPKWTGGTFPSRPPSF